MPYRQPIRLRRHLRQRGRVCHIRWLCRLSRSRHTLSHQATLRCHLHLSYRFSILLNIQHHLEELQVVNEHEFRLYPQDSYLIVTVAVFLARLIFVVADSPNQMWCYFQLLLYQTRYSRSYRHIGSIASEHSEDDLHFVRVLDCMLTPFAFGFNLSF